MSNWSIYLIYNPKTNQSYVGSTTDYWRRIQQHNRLRKGGASSTRKGAPHWQLSAVLEGFKTRSDACRWEAIIKKRFRGVDSRYWAFWDLSKGLCPKKNKTQKHYDPPKDLKLQTW